MAEVNEFLNKIIHDPEVNLLLNSIYDAVYIVDRDREILFWNEGAERITGYSKDEVLNKKCFDNILNHIDENGNLLCNSHCPLMECILYDKKTEAKIYPLTKDKKRLPVSTRIGPIKDTNGNIVGAIEVFRDISKEEDLRILQDKFSSLIKKFVSNNTYDQVKHQAKSGKNNTTKFCDLTILYVDIADFTAFAETKSMHDIVNLLNDVFEMCGEIIKKHQGDIDKFTGDAVMATFFDANDAVMAAREIWKKNKSLNVDRVKKKKENILLHIGINSGNVIQAEIGTPERKDITVLGDSVNIAKRIEEMSDTNAIYISESTFSRLKKPEFFTFYSTITVKGRKEPITVFKSVS
ncbi:MAG TPA: adenylate/guanylate cyclase domain-containing protein [Bacteroidales bacterium]|nr:adenylate/guanylate cyclase domain-containing protein [Bacteroidales bacterium]HPS18093.1 adenylate/guanylate cyclase domain-containing protein [Bacteroidales bacterium]